MKLSLRLRLTIWYSTIVAVSLALFGFLNYATVSQELNENLDSSIARVAETLDNLIRQKQQETNQPLKPAATQRHSRTAQTKSKKKDNFAFLRRDTLRSYIGPIRPIRDTASANDEQADVVWSAVYEHILLNPKNYLIQIADTANTIIWKSDNLRPGSLPLPSGEIVSADSVSSRRIVPRYHYNDQTLRLLLYRSSTVQISVGYPVSEIEGTLKDLFSSLVIALPGVLLLSTIGGWFLAKYSLQPIDDITRSAQDITAHNLSRRLPMPPVNDEVARLTETLNEMIARLEASFRQIQQFTGDASHELRTPLAILMGELEIALRTAKKPEEYQDVIISALEEVVRLSKVVEHLLELSRAESGQVEMHFELMKLDHMLTDIYEDAMILSEEREIQVHYTAEKNVEIYGDKVRLHQAFLNIVDNAIKYTPNGGEIFITLWREKQYAVVSIRDTGVGIPAQDINNIFDRFYRVDKARSQDVRGHGLGLAIVKWAIEAHNGSVELQSEVGKGTTFTVRLPYVQHRKTGFHVAAAKKRTN